MTTAHRRRGKSLHLDLSTPGSEDRPSLAALFLIKFDVKAGYTIEWQRTAPGLELGDSVEFKSLPSGLHNVAEDLVYFMHEDAYAGVSAFVNTASEQWERNALMMAVGVLVPREYGRLGRSWRHAPNLKEMAKDLASDITKTDILEQYWEANQASEETAPSDDNDASPEEHADRRMSIDSTNRKMKRRARVKSMSSAFGVTGSFLAPMHPALALPKMIHTFGPLIYPLYKAALLRKRILLVNEAPVELACNFVYNISIISNIPSSVTDLIPLEPLPHRLQPLFSIGVHDIDEVAARSSLETNHAAGGAPTDDGYGWVACTTDNVLSTKKNLYDVLVTIPHGAINSVPQRSWPVMTTPQGIEVRASQRDLRRYRNLRQCQKRSTGIPDIMSPYQATNGETVEESAVEEPHEETSRLIHTNTQETFDDASSTMDETLIEPMSWSALAYNSFMWWASAGEKRADLDNETDRDANLFRDFNAYSDTPGSSRSRRQSSPNPATPGSLSMLDGSAVPEMTLIGYFHRMTALLLGTLTAVVDAQNIPTQNGETEQEHDDNAKDESEAVYVSSEDMTRMGLDVWSDADRHFVEELLELYWGRRALVQGGRIECCGVRIL